MNRRLVAPAFAALVMLAVLLGLGAWQLRRLASKEALLAQIDRAESAPPVPLPARGTPAPFSRIILRGRLRADPVALYGIDVRGEGAAMRLGASLVEVLDRPGAPPVLVDLGWVPTDDGAIVQPIGGDATIIGYVRPAENPSWLSARDDLATRHFYTLNPTTIGAALGAPEVLPFTVVALSHVGPGPYPVPAASLPRPPNNHLQYALTWFGLAAVLVVIFASWVRRGGTPPPL